MANLTEREAFSAMFFFLEQYWERTNSDDIAVLLGGLNRSLWADGEPADPAAWQDWRSAVERALKGGK